MSCPVEVVAQMSALASPLAAGTASISGRLVGVQTVPIRDEVVGSMMLVPSPFLASRRLPSAS